MAAFTSHAVTFLFHHSSTNFSFLLSGNQQDEMSSHSSQRCEPTFRDHDDDDDDLLEILLESVHVYLYELLCKFMRLQLERPQLPVSSELHFC